MNFAKFLRTPFLQDTSERVPLIRLLFKKIANFTGKLLDNNAERLQQQMNFPEVIKGLKYRDECLTNDKQVEKTLKPRLH